MTPVKYQDFVTKGRDLVHAIDKLKDLERCYQAKIARYAISVCDIRHGGISTGIYTIKAYAIDIGLNPKSVQGWISTYRNVLERIGIEDPTPEEWKRAVKTDNILSLDRTIENKMSANKKKGYKRNLPKEHVREMYNAIDEKPFVGECHAITMTAKHDLYTVKNNIKELDKLPENTMQRLEKSAKYTREIMGVRDLSIAGQKRLIHLMEILDETSDIINDFLTKKAKSA